MAGWVEQHANVVLRLKVGFLRPELNRVGHGGVEVDNLEVEVQHHLLLPVDVRPRWANIVLRSLGRQVCHPARRTQGAVVIRLCRDLPAEQAGVEMSQRTGVGSIQNDTPPI